MKIKREALVGEYITDALLLLMQRKDYKDISITELCEKAGVTRMSFYRNFESKEDILKKWIGAITNDFLIASGISYKKTAAENTLSSCLTTWSSTRTSARRSGKPICFIL